jgi:UDP-2,3-diacylglucosamine pyrophosphatase LpxH
MIDFTEAIAAIVYNKAKGQQGVTEPKEKGAVVSDEGALNKINKYRNRSSKLWVIHGDMQWNYCHQKTAQHTWGRTRWCQTVFGNPQVQVTESHRGI